MPEIKEVIKKKFYSFEILENKSKAVIKKNGIVKTLINFFLQEKEKNIISSTDIFKKDFNGEFKKTDIGQFKILYSYIEKRKKGIFSKKLFCKIVLRCSGEELKIFEDWFFNKSQFIIIEQRQVTMARYNFTAQKAFHTNEDDYYYLSCSYGVHLKNYLNTFFPALKLNVTVKVRKCTNTYKTLIIKDFYYKCIVEGEIHIVIHFKRNFLNHYLSGLLIEENEPGAYKNVSPDNLYFI